jgi:tRNA-dependent cyclodipeptide synthase
MKAKVEIVRESTEEEVKSKKFNIYIGISLGNKWFTKDNLREHLRWSLKYTKKRVGLLVADTLHSINYEVRNDMRKERAIKKSLRKGDEMIEMLKELIWELPKSQQKQVDIIRWEDVKANSFNKKFLNILHEEFNHNKEFRKYILNIVKKHLKKADEKFSEEKIIKLGEYIIDELPELLHGFKFKGTLYNCYTYPYDSLLTQMVEKIYNKELFPQLSKKLDIKQNVFVGLRVI